MNQLTTVIDVNAMSATTNRLPFLMSRLRLFIACCSLLMAAGCSSVLEHSVGTSSSIVMNNSFECKLSVV